MHYFPNTLALVTMNFYTCCATCISLGYYFATTFHYLSFNAQLFWDQKRLVWIKFQNSVNLFKCVDM